MITVSRAGSSVTPTLVVDGYEFARESGNTVHRVIGDPVPSVTYGALATKSGTLALLFPVGDTASPLAAVNLHAAAGPVTLADTDVPEAAMTYVALGTVSLKVDPTTGRRVVTVPFQALS